MEEFTTESKQKSELEYTIKEIFEELNCLEKQVLNSNPFKMDKKTKEIINYYMNNRRVYDNMMIEAKLEEIGFELLLQEASE